MLQKDKLSSVLVTRLSSTGVQIISVYRVLLFGTINNTSLFQLQWFKFYLVVILVKLTILTELESILYVVKTKENPFLLLKNQTQFHITTAISVGSSSTLCQTII